MLRTLCLAGGALLFAYGGLCALAYACQRVMLYPAPKAGRLPASKGVELLQIPGNGSPIFALYRPATADRATVVHFHGNGEELADTEPLIDEYGAQGLGVMSVEYPGYGLCAAQRVGEEAIYETAVAAVQHLQRVLGVAPDRIILQGQSLGTGVAVELARRGYGAALVLISPYTSIVEMGQRLLPFLPVRSLLSDRFESIDKLAGIQHPALVIHGTEDEVVPFDMGQRVAAALPRGVLHTVSGGHHNDLFSHFSPAIVPRVVAFAGSLEQRAAAQP